MHAPPAASGCGVNFEKMRKRRIEAIRGQILSKLGFLHVPTDELPPPDSLTNDIVAMYNRTRDFVLEQARKKREECLEPEDSYYAQDITTVYMKNRNQAASTIPGSTSREFRVNCYFCNCINVCLGTYVCAGLVPILLPKVPGKWCFDPLFTCHGSPGELKRSYCAKFVPASLNEPCYPKTHNPRKTGAKVFLLKVSCWR